MSDLKKCPFCKSRAEHYLFNYRKHTVRCRHCLADCGEHDTPERAAFVWNTRPAEESLRKQLEDLLYFLRFVAEDVECNSMPGLASRIDEEIKKHEQKGER